MKRVAAGALDVAYLELGPDGGMPVILLHGFPYDVNAYTESAGKLAALGVRCIVPYLRGYGATRFASDATFRSGQQAALGSDLKALLDALNVETAVLGGYDWGGRAACVVAGLWPERVHGLVTCGTAFNIQDSTKVAVPTTLEGERRRWYWFYLNSERGRKALADQRHEFGRYLWKAFSPTWNFSDSTYDRTAASFENPDFVDVVVHSYRYRIGAVGGDPSLEALERRISAQTTISVPTIALSGADDAVDPPKAPEEVRDHFPQLKRQAILPGIGHNVPQEAPNDFVRAVIELSR